MKHLHWLWLALFTPAVHAAGDPVQVIEEGFGPLTVRSQSPLQALRLVPLPRAPILPRPGQSEFRALSSVSSIWARTDDYTIDAHFLDLRVAVAHGLSEDWAVEFGINERRTVNAGLDHLSVAFHDLFGISQSGRDEVPKNDTHILIPRYGIDFRERRALSRFAEATVIHRLRGHGGPGPAVALAGTLRYEFLDDGPPSDGTVDYGLQLSLAQPVGKRSRIYADLAYVWFGEDNFGAMPLRDSQHTLMLAYEWRQRDSVGFLFEYLYSQGVGPDLGELDAPSHELVFGLKWLRPSGLWEFALTENIINFNNSPDVAFTVGFSARF